MMALIKFLVAFAVATASALLSAEPIEIIAIGDSQTNARGVADPAGSYPAQLEAMLKADGYDVVVKKSGIDGELTYAAYNRMKNNEVTDKTKIVIFQQSGNDAAANASAGLEYAEKALHWLQERKISAVFISSRRIMPDEAALALAEQYGALYHGPLYKKIPRDDEHVQPGEYFAKKQATDFHLTAKGYGVLATQLKPLVVKIIKEKGF